MDFELITVPCLADNYAFLLHKNGRTAVIDVPEASPIMKELAARGWNADEIWITHHHNDHIDGVDELRSAHGSHVVGGSSDANRLPSLNASYGDGDSFSFAGSEVQVMDVSGHTIGHIALYVPDARAVFTADSLMALGCGRLFEGTPEQMWESLSKLAALPGDTTVCSGHEYTASNLAFAMTIEPQNPDLQERGMRIAVARDRGKPTVPSTLSEELATNPFLRAGLAEVKSGLNMSGEADSAVFAEIRKRKDSF